MRQRRSLLLHVLFLGGCALVLACEGGGAAKSLDCLLRGPYPGGAGASQERMAEAPAGRAEAPGAGLQLASAAER